MFVAHLHQDERDIWPGLCILETPRVTCAEQLHLLKNMEPFSHPGNLAPRVGTETLLILSVLSVTSTGWAQGE